MSPREVPLSGFLVAVLIAVWAVVLVPMWAHRQSPPETERPAGGRIISRRPERPATPAQHSARSGSFGIASASQPQASMLRRRRSVLAVLAGVLLLTAAAVLVGLPPVILALPILLFAGLLVWLRRTAAQAAAARRRALRRQVAAQRAAGFRDFGVQLGAPATSDEPVATPAYQAAGEVPAEAGTAASAAPSAAPWLPVPLPLPSYVTAAPAPTVIDADWHEEILLEGELPGEASAYALGDEGLRRRAVGD